MIKNGKVVTIPSMDVKVGDILVLTENDVIPADCVALYSSNSNGICYMQTTNIDGETNLKMRNSVPLVQEKLDKYSTQEERVHALCEMDLEIECPTPNSHIYQFPAVYV